MCLTDRFQSRRDAAIENPRGHTWERDEDGQVDFTAFAVDYHNGPRCVVCGYVYCEHCRLGPHEDCTPKQSVADKALESTPFYGQQEQHTPILE